MTDWLPDWLAHSLTHSMNEWKPDCHLLVFQPENKCVNFGAKTQQNTGAGGKRKESITASVCEHGAHNLQISSGFQNSPV